MSDNENKIVEGGFRTTAEIDESTRLEDCFLRNPDSLHAKLDSFPKYARRPSLTRFLALYEIFKMIVDVKGSVVECGVYRGFGTMTWAKLSAILEPVNLTRRIYGFDTFAGFPSLSEKDLQGLGTSVAVGDLFADSKDELDELAAINDSTRFLGHIPKVSLIKGDAVETIPQFVEENPHLLISLLFLDFDLYEPTMAALENLVPKMPKGAIIAFDELDNPLWPGETQAMLEYFSNNKLKIERLDFDPYIGYARIE